MNRAELDEAFERLREDRLRDRYDGPDREALRILARVPVWTEALATASGVLGLSNELESLLARWRREAIVERDGPRFWMTDRARDEILSSDARDPSIHDLKIASIVRGVPGRGYPAATVRWAELVDQMASAPRGDTSFVRERIDALIGEDRTAEAAEWIDSARFLARTWREHVGDDAVRLAEYRLERAHERAIDEHALGTFLPRDEQIAAFHRLLDGPDDRWALHYLGMGGVDRTTLLRHIAARLAPERHAPLARIDFDFLSPQYPVTQPGQLVSALARQLVPSIERTSHERILCG